MIMPLRIPVNAKLAMQTPQPKTTKTGFARLSLGPMPLTSNKPTAIYLSESLDEASAQNQATYSLGLCPFVGGFSPQPRARKQRLSPIVRLPRPITIHNFQVELARRYPKRD